jgi:ABC-2 type transport system ATP-binding protein
MTPRIEIDHLTKSYGDKVAVRDLSLTVRSGEVFCFLGPNGAGKTTTIHTIVGHKNPTAGDVRINGVHVGSPEIHEVRRAVGYMAEQPVLYDYLTGREFLLFIAELFGVDASRRDWIDEQLERLELGGDADTLIKTYSLGMKKKIAFLAALVPDPDILLFDEPTGSLDAASARLVKDHMLEARDAGKLVFFTTHIMEIAERLADRLAVIHHGRLIAEGTLDDLRQQFGRTPGESLEDIFLRITGGDAGRDSGNPIESAAPVGRNGMSWPDSR